MATAAPASVFVSGDIVLQNPKETGVIFALVVILAVILENLFAAFRENKSKYVKLLFVQISEEIMIIGTIGLVFVFIVQSVDDLPPRWVMLFRWSNTVLFFLMAFFVLGILITALFTTLFIRKLRRIEEQIVEQHVKPDSQIKFSALERAFLALRTIYMQQVRHFAEKAPANSLTSQMSSIPLSKYLEVQTRTTVVKFTDVTWQSWLSLIFAASANSIRLFLLPDDFHKRAVTGLETKDRVINQVTFVIVLGWVPTIGYLIGVGLLIKRMLMFLANVDKKRGNVHVSSQDHAQPLLGKSRVYLPPKQLASEMVGESYEDPARYLLRANRSFTLHVLKIPAIIIEYYLAIYVVGMWGLMSRTVGVAQLGLIPLALAPVVLIFVFLPLSLLIVTVLTTLGSRLDQKLLKKLLVERRAKQSGDEDDADEMQNKTASDGPPAVLEVPETDDLRTERQVSQVATNNSVNAEEVASLKARIKFLEDLCASYGIPIGEKSIDEDGSYSEHSNMASIYLALTKLQDETKRISDQQTQLTALHRAQRGGGTAIHSLEEKEATSSSRAIQALSAAKRLDAPFQVSGIQRPNSGTSHLSNIQKAVNL